MKNIAFIRYERTLEVPNFVKGKRQNLSTLERSLPLRFITEFADTSLFPEGTHTEEDGWEILPEDEFLLELAKNTQHLEDFRKEKERLLILVNNARVDEEHVERKTARELEREFEEFKRWKANKEEAKRREGKRR